MSERVIGSSTSSKLAHASYLYTERVQRETTLYFRFLPDLVCSIIEFATGGAFRLILNSRLDAGLCVVNYALIYGLLILKASITCCENIRSFYIADGNKV